MAEHKLSRHTREAILDLQDWIEKSDPGGAPRAVPMPETAPPKPPLLALSALAGASVGGILLVAAWIGLS